MKKTLMMAAAAATMIAAPAFAQTPGAGTQYADGIATYEFRAPVVNFCKFGSAGNGDLAGSNVTTFDRAISVAEGDRGFNVNIQNPADNTVQGASGGFVFAQAQCNTRFNVTSTSTNAGLQSSYSGNASAAFLRKVPYQIAFARGASGANTRSDLQDVASTNTLISNADPYAGAMSFQFAVRPNGGLLLAGSYTDTVVVTMAPVTGNSPQ